MNDHHKLSKLVGEEWVRAEGAGIFTLQQTTGPMRLAIAPRSSPVALVEDLARTLPPPLVLLWILHTPRTEVHAGRYQSPPLDKEDAFAFLRRFAAFLENDARSDIWVHSEEPATIVYERHDVIYAYGPLERYELLLRSQGLEPGKVLIPSPHAHNYHQDFDPGEQAIAAAFDWIATPLQPEDEQ